MLVQDSNNESQWKLMLHNPVLTFLSNTQAKTKYSCVHKLIIIKLMENGSTIPLFILNS